MPLSENHGNYRLLLSHIMLSVGHRGLTGRQEAQWATTTTTLGSARWLVGRRSNRAEDSADERALAKDAPGSRSTSPVLERRSDALKGFTVGAKVRHKVYKVDALFIQLAAAGDFLLDKEKVRIEWEKVE